MDSQQIITYQDGRCALCSEPLEPGASVQSVDMHAFGPRATVTLRCWLCNGCRPSPETLSVTSARLAERLLGWYRPTRPSGLRCGCPPMDELWSSMDADADAMYRVLLDRLGLGHITCSACARVLLPPPFNWESYTYTATNGRSWTWDIACARALVARRSMSERLTLEPKDVHAWLANHGQVNDQHLGHIPSRCLEEPVLLAAVPDGQGHVMIDGSHRATIRTRSGLHVEGFLLSVIESALAIGTVPLAMRRIAAELHRRRLLPDDPGH